MRIVFRLATGRFLRPADASKLQIEDPVDDAYNHLVSGRPAALPPLSWAVGFLERAISERNKHIRKTSELSGALGCPSHQSQLPGYIPWIRQPDSGSPSEFHQAESSCSWKAGCEMDWNVGRKRPSNECHGPFRNLFTGLSVWALARRPQRGQPPVSVTGVNNRDEAFALIQIVAGAPSDRLADRG
jgi:hypothetical protein